jgi:outer membrane murein-binding lipoprotein Lpp
MEIRMKKFVVLATLVALISASGCSFFMKEYDDRNERKLAALSKDNKALTSKMKNLERKVPDMSKQLNTLDAENRKLKKKVTDLSGKIEGSYKELALEDISTMAKESSNAEPAPAPAPDEKPFEIASNDETAPGKPEVQAKAKLTGAGAKLLEMAKKQESTGDQPDAEGLAELAAKPEEKTEAKPEEKTEAKPEEKTEAKPEEKVVAKPDAEPDGKPEAQSKKTAKKSALTSEGAKLLALAKGESVPSGKSSPAPKTKKQTKIEQIAKAKTAPTTRGQSVKLKVLSGTGNISSAHTMAKKLQGIGFEAEKKALAPRSNFKKNVVYHAKGHEQTAQKLKNTLGEKTVLKPLSWNSEFDIIVVSVE